MAWQAIALTTDYATERRQYGVPVGSFQAVQHLLADALVADDEPGDADEQEEIRDAA
jgi:alkylation response protein AidB-like acyl-CoA dehydrogenase